MRLPFDWSCRPTLWLSVDLGERVMVGIVNGMPRVLLRLEGLAVLIASSVGYAWQGGSWWLFAILFFVPDISMIGYVAGGRIGAALYNFAHWYCLPLACLIWGASTHTPQALDVGLVWAAHIGFDRSLGYGLKYPEGFGVSHLGRMGKAHPIT
jgi:hypothetical protein